MDLGTRSGKHRGQDADIRIQGDILYQWKHLLNELAEREIRHHPLRRRRCHGQTREHPLHAVLPGHDVMRRASIHWKIPATSQGGGQVRQWDGFQRKGSERAYEPFMRCTIDDLDDERIILGRDLASNLNALKGDTIEVFTLMMEKAKKDEVLLPGN